jgi:hypothetical protein
LTTFRIVRFCPAFKGSSKYVVDAVTDTQQGVVPLVWGFREEIRTFRSNVKILLNIAQGVALGNQEMGGKF